MKTVRRPPYPKWNPGYFPCSSLTPLPLSSRRPSVSFGGFGLRVLARPTTLWPGVKFRTPVMKHRSYPSLVTAPYKVGTPTWAYLSMISLDISWVANVVLHLRHNELLPCGRGFYHAQVNPWQTKAAKRRSKPDLPFSFVGVYQPTGRRKDAAAKDVQCRGHLGLQARDTRLGTFVEVLRGVLMN